jgi:hypothetical protein
MKYLRAGLAGVALLLAGCGPTPPLEVSMHSYPSDITIGGDQPTLRRGVPASGPGAVALSLPNRPVPVPLSATVIKPRPYGPGNLPPPTAIFPVPPQPGPPSCNTSPLTPVDRSATADSPYAPAGAAYKYRQLGNFWNPNGTAQPYPVSSTRTVTNVAPPNPPPNTSYTFDVTQTSTDSVGTVFTTTYSYHVVAGHGLTGGDPTGITPITVQDPGGIYITKITSDDPGSIFGALSAPFAPVATTTGGSPAGIKILNLLADTGTQWDTSGTDPSGLSLTLHGVTLGRQQVDACGAVLQTWGVHLYGTIGNPTGASSSRPDGSLVDLSWGIGTEYGGFLLSEVNCESTPKTLLPKQTACDVANVLSYFSAISQRPVLPAGAPSTPL